MRHSIAVGRPELKSSDCDVLSIPFNQHKTMYKQIEIIRNTREKVLELVTGLSEAQMNEIPDGFVNNLAWHIGHLVVTQQSLCYGRAGMPMLVSSDLSEKYKPGTTPETFISAAEIDELKSLLAALPDRLDEDCYSPMFENYPPWTNRYGTAISSIGDVLSFVTFHEGLHYGYMMALKRAFSR